MQAHYRIWLPIESHHSHYVNEQSLPCIVVPFMKIIHYPWRINFTQIYTYRTKYDTCTNINKDILLWNRCWILLENLHKLSTTILYTVRDKGKEQFTEERRGTSMTFGPHTFLISTNYFYSIHTKIQNKINVSLLIRRWTQFQRLLSSACPFRSSSLPSPGDLCPTIWWFVHKEQLSILE